MDIRNKKNSRNNPAESGFTIVEALIAIILFTITLAGGMSIYLHGNRIVALSTHKRIAVEIANLRMEELRAMSYTAFNTAFPVSNPLVPEVFTDANPPTIGQMTAARTITVTNVPPVATPDYKEVEVNVSWTEANHVDPREVILTSIIAP